MAPIIEVSDEHYGAIKTLGVPHKLVETPRVEVVSEPYIEVPGLNIAIAKERTHQGKNWYDSHDALKQEDARMLTLPEFAGFLNYLKSNQNNKEYQEILKDITEVRSPWRAEWLDAFFEKRDGELYILTQNKANAEKLKGGLMKDKTPGISLDAWLKNPTKQGLPESNVKDGDLFYWHPRNQSVAWFYANSDRANLDCDDRYPSGRNSFLGVRAVKDL